MKYQVVVADDLHERGIELLRQVPEFEVVCTGGDSQRLAEALEGGHALLVRSSTQVTEALLMGAPLLKVIGRAGIGVDNIDVEAATRHGVAVLNTPGANTVSAAEHMFALLLALVRRIPGAAESMRSGEWNRKRFGGTELRGKTLGLIGLGRIGRHVADIGRAFGMEILAHDPFVSDSRAKELQVKLASVEELLATADVVSLHVPITDDTQHLINGKRLALMKPTAVLVNTARGGLVDGDALLEAVEQNRIAGAALDVFDPEPLPADSPLRRSDRIILTPHLAASTHEAQERVSVEVCRSIEQALLYSDYGGAINIPGISAEAVARLRHPLILARRIGRLATDLACGPISSVEVHYGGDDDGAPQPIMVAAVEGVLQSLGVGPVSLVNARAVAKERNVSLSRHVGKAEDGFEMTIGVTLQSSGCSTTVVGGLVGEQTGRVIQIDEFAVNIPAAGHVLVLRNRDVPGVIGQVGTLLGEANINIGSYHQAHANGEGLAAIALDQPLSEDIVERLEGIPDIVEVRVACLDHCD
jgi:D-3-phosphoglycerate dehydrogenase